jgi:hypothetical protein
MSMQRNGPLDPIFCELGVKWDRDWGGIDECLHNRNGVLVRKPGKGERRVKDRWNGLEGGWKEGVGVEVEVEVDGKEVEVEEG